MRNAKGSAAHDLMIPPGSSNCARLMRERMAASPLCDVAGFTRLLEDAYRDAWRQIATETALPAESDEVADAASDAATLHNEAH